MINKITPNIIMCLFILSGLNIAKAASIEIDKNGVNYIKTYNGVFYANNPFYSSLTFPIFIRDLTENYLSAIIDSGARINGAFGHNFILESSNWNAPYNNRIFIVEMNLGSNFFGTEFYNHITLLLQEKLLLAMELLG